MITDIIIKKLNKDIEKLINEVDSITKSINDNEEEIHINIIKQLSRKAKELKDGEETQDKIYNMSYSIKKTNNKYYIIVLGCDKPFVDTLNVVGKELFRVLDQIVYMIDRDKLL